jgi:RNA polymerase sigma factor (sigma-70 family)
MSVSSADRIRDANPGSGSTASDLLNAAKRMDADAWRELVNRYSWLVFQWCRNAGLCAQDAADVVQGVLAQVAIYLPDFQKDGRAGAFRRWLRTITRSKIADFRRCDRGQPHGEGGSAAQQRMLAIPEDADSSTSANPALEALRNRLWIVVDRLEDEFEESTWQAFWLTVIENQTAGEVGGLLEMTPNAVRIAKWRVLKRLREEAGALETDPPAAATPA